MATAIKTPGEILTDVFGELGCPECGATEDGLDLSLRTGEIHCGNCDSDYTVELAVEKARETLKKWEKLAKWVELAKTV